MAPTIRLCEVCGLLPGEPVQTSLGMFHLCPSCRSDLLDARQRYAGGPPVPQPPVRTTSWSEARRMTTQTGIPHEGPRPSEGHTPPEESFTCPKCGRTSYNPMDAKHGYCGNCRDFTAPR